MLVGSVQRLTTKAVRPSPVRSFVPSRVSSVQKSVQQRQVEVRFFKFGNGKSKQQFEAEASLIIDPQCREDYDWDDLEGYFNYMGFLAVEGSNDGMEALLKHVGSPIDCILLLACTENDTPKVNEVLQSGADLNVTNLKGKRPIELATKPEVIALLKEYEAKAKAAASV